MPVFINEIHYGNVGADAGKAVEIAGTAGTDLSSWQLIFCSEWGGASYANGVLQAPVNGDRIAGLETALLSAPRLDQTVFVL